MSHQFDAAGNILPGAIGMSCSCSNMTNYNTYYYDYGSGPTTSLSGTLNQNPVINQITCVWYNGQMYSYLGHSYGSGTNINTMFAGTVSTGTFNWVIDNWGWTWQQRLIPGLWPYNAQSNTSSVWQACDHTINGCLDDGTGVDTGGFAVIPGVPAMNYGDCCDEPWCNDTSNGANPNSLGVNHHYEANCCEYQGCTDPNGGNYNVQITIDCNGDAVGTQNPGWDSCCDYFGCPDTTGTLGFQAQGLPAYLNNFAYAPYNPLLWSNYPNPGDCDNNPGGTVSWCCSFELFACTDSTNSNYWQTNVLYTTILAAAGGSGAFASIPAGESNFSQISSGAISGPAVTVTDDGSCDLNIGGCTDPLASNYNPTATVDDGSCIYDVNGCTDPLALNYNPAATIDDGSCVYDLDGPIPGCTDPNATNYCPLCNVDNGTCTYVETGCMDPTAINYNTSAQIDDGSCLYDFDVYVGTNPFNGEPVELCQEPLTKEEALMNICQPTEIQSEVFIERGKQSVYEQNQRLGEIQTIGGLELYGYGFYKINKTE